MQLTSTFILLASLIVSLPAAASQCLQGQEAWEYPQSPRPYPMEMSYEGFFPQSSEGALIRAFLDDERILHALKIELLNETGKATAVFAFDSRSAYTVSWVEADYRFPIYEDAAAEVVSSEGSCFVVEEGKVAWSSEGASTEFLESLQKVLDLALADYLPCGSVSFPAGD